MGAAIVHVRTKKALFDLDVFGNYVETKTATDISGDSPEGSETVTIAFNAEHKVSIQLGTSAGMLKTN